MPGATDDNSTPAPAKGDAFTQAVERMKEIAAQSGDALLLADGPPHPDHQLLDVCADALHHRSRSEAAHEQWEANDAQRGECWTDADRRASVRDSRAWQACEKNLRQLLFKAKKMPATTPAGIYAKALLVRSSRTAATHLAMSLAEDLVKAPGLRESLWPATKPV